MAKTKTRNEAPTGPAEFPFDVDQVGERSAQSPLEQMPASPTIEQPPIEPKAIEEAAAEVKAQSLLVELPIGAPHPKHYRFTHLDVHLDGAQSETMRELYDGCFGQRLANGRKVTSAADVIRFFLDECRRQKQSA